MNFQPADRLLAIVDLQQIRARHQDLQHVVQRAQAAGVKNFLLRAKAAPSHAVQRVPWPQVIDSIRGQGGRVVLHDSLLFGCPALIADAPYQHWSARSITEFLDPPLPQNASAPAETLRAMHQAADALGASVHNAKELQHAEVAGASWALISPWKPSLSKAQRGEFLGPQGLRKLRELSSFPLFALSGISAQTIPELDGLSIQGCAVMGLLTNPHASVELKALLDQMEKQRWANPLPW